jgi:hypothetical protein
MCHIVGHPTIDKFAHKLGIVKPHNHDVNTSQKTNNKEQTSSLSQEDNISIKKSDSTSTNKTIFSIPKHNHNSIENLKVKTAKDYDSWVPFKSSKTGAAVGAMSGQIFGMTAGFASAAIVAGVSKNYKMALIVGATVYATSLAAGAVGGAVGYKTRGMNIDTTEPPMGTLFDTQEEAKKNMEKSEKKWSTVFKK